LGLPLSSAELLKTSEERIFSLTKREEKFS